MDDGEWVVLTPGGDLCPEYIDGYSRTILLTGRRRYPNRVGSVVEFKFPISDREIVGHITDGAREARRIVQDKGSPDPEYPVVSVNWNGVAQPLPTPGPIAGVSRRLYGKQAVSQRPGAERSSFNGLRRCWWPAWL